MKKCLFILLMILSCCFSVSAQSYTIKNNVYKTENSTSTRSASVETPYKFEYKGKEYPIFISKSGKCFIKVISEKSGKPYNKYLPEEIASDVRKKMNFTPSK